MDILKAIFSFIKELLLILIAIAGLWMTYVSNPKVQMAAKPLLDFFNRFRKTGSLENNNATKNSVNNLLPNDLKKDKPKQTQTNLYITLGGLLIISIVLTILANPPKITIFDPAPTHTNLKPSGGMNVISLFWMYIILFGVIGAVRGWAKELLVIVSGVTALAIILILEKYIPFIRDIDKASVSLFWIRVLILSSLVYFGYQAVTTIERLASKSSRERLQDSLFGYILGGVNGYLIVGSILYYFHIADYPYPNIIAPATDSIFSEAVLKVMTVMPPLLLGEPGIYFAAIIVVIFLIIVYI